MGSIAATAALTWYERIGIGTDLLSAAQVRHVTDSEARELYGFRFNGDLSGIVFPYFDPVNGN